MGRAENIVSNAVIREFGTRPDMRIWRQNTGVATFKGRSVRFGVPGQADISGILPGGVRLEIETKSADGRQSAEQKNWQRMIEKYNGVYVLARSVEDVWAKIGWRLLNGAAGQAGANP